jgi:hypothetical protein
MSRDRRYTADQAEIREALWLTVGDRHRQVVEMRHAALVGCRYLPVDHEAAPEFGQPREGGAKPRVRSSPLRQRRRRPLVPSAMAARRCRRASPHIIESSFPCRWFWASSGELERDGRAERRRPRAGGQTTLFHGKYPAQIGTEAIKTLSVHATAASTSSMANSTSHRCQRPIERSSRRSRRHRMGVRASERTHPQRRESQSVSF